MSNNQNTPPSQPTNNQGKSDETRPTAPRKTITPAPSSKPMPWDNAVIPPAYAIDANGVWLKSSDSEGDAYELGITYQPVWVARRLRAPDRDNWTLEIRWKTADNADKSLFIGQEQIYNSDLMKVLGRGGLGIADLKLLCQYLNESANHPHQRLEWGVTQLGYALIDLTNGRKGLCYVWPDETQYARCYVEDARIDAPTRLLPQTLNAISAFGGFHAQGTLEEWQQHIAEPTRGQTLHTFALLVSFAGMLQQYAQVENAGFHFYGHSSRGKTIALQVACTVYGNGADPKLDSSAPTLMNSWNSTGNALEPLAVAFTNKVLTMDEMGMHTAPNSPAYALFNGRGKDRMSGDGGLRQRHQWNVLVLSSGEISYRHYIETVAKRPIMAGEAARLLDIPIDDLSSTAEAAVFEALKRNCGRCYGAAGRAFIQSILDNVEGDEATLKEGIISGVNEIVAELKEKLAQEGFVLQSHQQRALRTFALVLFTGRADLKDENRILPHTAEEIEEAVMQVLRAWLTNQEFQSEEERAIQRLRDYYQRFQAQFRRCRSDHKELPTSINAPGVEVDGYLYLDKAQFEAACAGLEVQSVARALIKAGILHTNDKHHKVKVDLKSCGLKGRYYKLNLKQLLGEEFESAMSSPSRSIAASPRRINAKAKGSTAYQSVSIEEFIGDGDTTL